MRVALSFFPSFPLFLSASFLPPPIPLSSLLLPPPLSPLLPSFLSFSFYFSTSTLHFLSSHFSSISLSIVDQLISLHSTLLYLFSSFRLFFSSRLPLSLCDPLCCYRCPPHPGEVTAIPPIPLIEYIQSANNTKENTTKKERKKNKSKSKYKQNHNQS